MIQRLDALVRKAMVGDQNVGDVRFVVTADGRAAVIGRNADGAFHVVAAATGATWRTERDGRIAVDVTGDTWAGQRDTRCGSCHGRYELRTVNAEQFLPHIEERPDDAEPGTPVAAPGYSDTY